MKNTIKTFIWIGMIIQFFLIYPIVIGILALKRIDNTTTKQELQTISIVTLLFCSLIAGILMLTISEEELRATHTSNGLFSSVKVLDDNQSDTQQVSGSHSLIISILIGLIGILSLVSLIFSIVGLAVFESFVPFIINIVVLPIYSLITYLFVKNKQDKFNIGKLSLCLLFIAQIVLSVLSIDVFMSVYSWTDWVTFGIAIAQTVAMVCTLIFCKRITKRRYKYVKVNNLECQLQELQDMLDKQIVTEDEYKKMRESVISKYFK